VNSFNQVDRAGLEKYVSGKNQEFPVQSVANVIISVS
jgi:hypothetical protein